MEESKKLVESAKRALNDNLELQKDSSIEKKDIDTLRGLRLELNSFLWGLNNMLTEQLRLEQAGKLAEAQKQADKIKEQIKNNPTLQSKFRHQELLIKEIAKDVKIDNKFIKNEFKLEVDADKRLQRDVQLMRKMGRK